MSRAARLLCVGTHHKTGTIWMRKVFRAIAADQTIPFMQCNRPRRLKQVAPTGAHILVNWHSAFPRPLFKMPDARFFHLIRDPRDVLLSGMRYHRIAPLGNEKFLRVPRPEFGGLNYQDHLNGLSDDLERLKFEMAHKHHDTVAEMLAWPADHPRAVTVRYEDLIADTDCRLFRGILSDFAIEGLDTDRAVATFWDRSLFGGLADPADRSDRLTAHVGPVAARQWESRLPREIAEIYAETYGGALAQLGYAHDDGWVRRCKPARALARH